MNYSDFELVYMVKEDEEAFGYMLKKYEPLFKRLSYSFAQKYKHKGIDYEDLVQQCRITFCYVVDKFDSNRDILFYSFLLISLNRALRNYIRKYIRKPDCYSYMDLPNFDISSSFDIHEDYINTEYERKLIFFKNSLDFLESNIFELRYNNFTYSEIAILLDINYKKVDNSLVKIRKRLEKFFLFS